MMMMVMVRTAWKRTANLMPLWLSTGRLGRCRGDDLVDLSCDVALETADDLAAGFALGDAPGEVVAGPCVPAQGRQSDPIERGVGLAIASAVES